MKKLILIAMVFTGLNTSYTHAQTNNKSSFSFCNGAKDKDTINAVNFDNCLRLICNDKKQNIKSYTISIFIPDEKNKKTGAYKDYAVVGDRAGKEVIASLKKDKPTQLLIEKIITTEGDIEKKHPGMVLYVK